MEEKIKEEILELDTEQLEGFLDMDIPDKLPPIVLAVEDYDMDDFERGIKDMSYEAGKITALLNAGVSESFVLDFLLNQETIKHNLKTAEINKDMNVEISKNQRLVQEKNEL